MLANCLKREPPNMPWERSQSVSQLKPALKHPLNPIPPWRIQAQMMLSFQTLTMICQRFS